MSSSSESLCSLLESAIMDAVRDHPTLMRLALSQRAKFEGWLKLELAARMAEQGVQQVRLESPCQGGRADLSFDTDGGRVFVELKTCNTNYGVKGCEPRTRPITKNVEAICTDCRTLRSVSGVGVMAFVVFPLDAGSQRKIAPYLDRIRDSAGLEEPPDGTFVDIIGGVGLSVHVFAVKPPRGRPD